MQSIFIATPLPTGLTLPNIAAWAIICVRWQRARTQRLPILRRLKPKARVQTLTLLRRVKGAAGDPSILTWAVSIDGLKALLGGFIKPVQGLTFCQAYLDSLANFNGITFGFFGGTAHDDGVIAQAAMDKLFRT